MTRGQSNLDTVHIVNVLPPVADAFAGAVVYTDIVNAQGHSITFLKYNGVGAAGTSTITVEACDDNVPTTTATVPFIYREYTTSDVPGAWTAAAATGFTCTAGTNYMVEIRVDPGHLAAVGYEYVRLHLTEVANFEVLGGVLCFIENLRYAVQASTLL